MQQNQQQGGEQKKSLSWSESNLNNQRNQQQQSATASSSVTTKTANVPTNAKRTAAIFAAVVILFALVVWGTTALRGQGDAVATETGSQTETNGSNKAVSGEGSGALFTVAAQPAGNTVSVTGISVVSPTWVVVYDNNSGKPGNTLGAALVFQGQSSVTVPLLRATVSGKSYLVGESPTEGDSHNYSRTVVPLDALVSFVAQ